jgi:hypothetical protein
MVGRILSHYKVLEELSRGGMDRKRVEEAKAKSKRCED